MWSSLATRLRMNMTKIIPHKDKRIPATCETDVSKADDFSLYFVQATKYVRGIDSLSLSLSLSFSL